MRTKVLRIAGLLELTSARNAASKHRYFRRLEYDTRICRPVRTTSVRPGLNRRIWLPRQDLATQMPKAPWFLCGQFLKFVILRGTLFNSDTARLPWLDFFFWSAWNFGRREWPLICLRQMLLSWSSRSSASRSSSLWSSSDKPAVASRL